LVDQSVADLAAAVITPPQHHIQRGGDHRDVLDRRHPPSNCGARRSTAAACSCRPSSPSPRNSETPS